ncbi:uncharacterized protein raw isoform X2 [Bemisia tabaci]|uniref:uncharacterized protein raw isoform X2 n=1 Tax=Bemisia tabaci TaxID=7038 RepID=UPI003B28CAE9
MSSLFILSKRRRVEEALESWSQNFGSAFSEVPYEKLAVILHELQSYPSADQVDEMLQSVQKCRKRSTGLYLTFSELCTFTSEFKKCYEKGVPFPAQLSRLLERDGPHKKRKARKMSSMFITFHILFSVGSFLYFTAAETLVKERVRSIDHSPVETASSTEEGIPKNDVFLGGSCNPTTWRQDIAIPLLNKLGITFYNPQVSQWRQELIELEHQAKEAASILLYVLDDRTRNVVGIIETAFFAGNSRKLVLVMSIAEPGNIINGEAISQIESDDLRLAQFLLQDLVKKHGISVFDNIPLAVSCAAKIVQDNKKVPDLEYSNSVELLKNNSLIVPDKQLDLQKVFSAIDTTNSGEISLSDVCQLLTKHNLSQTELRGISSQVTGSKESNIGEVKINFSQFCSIFSGLKTSLNSDDAEKWVVRWRYNVISKGNNDREDLCLVGDISDSDLMVTSLPKMKKVNLSILRFPKNEEGINLIDKYQVLIFHIPATTRGLSTMTLASYYIGQGCEVILSIQMMKKNTTIKGEVISPAAISDYNRGRSYLSDFAKKESLPVFDNLNDALLCAVNRVSSTCP